MHSQVLCSQAANVQQRHKMYQNPANYASKTCLKRSFVNFFPLLYFAYVGAFWIFTFLTLFERNLRQKGCLVAENGGKKNKLKHFVEAN